MQRLPIHPVQYLLVGFGLAIFFLLLISFSEHLVFAGAYLIASAATIGLLGFYLSFVLRSIKRGVTFSLLLTVLYAAVYGLIRSEDNALLLGSLLLFAVLAGIMYVTRKVNWYRGSEQMLDMRSETIPNYPMPVPAAPPPPSRNASS